MNGRRERKMQQMRRALLDGAIALFGERGIAATRVEDITERADLAKGAFYNYFDSKDGLVAELLYEGIEVLHRDYLSKLDGQGDLPSRVRELATLHKAFFDDHPEHILLFHQARGLLQVKRERADKLRKAFVDHLERIGRLLPPPSEGDDWGAAERLDLAAAIAGAMAGYRSFRIAAGLEGDGATAREILALGIPPLLERRRR